MEDNENKVLENLKRLKEPMDYQWRIQSCSVYDATATCVAYIDARDAQDRLDEVFPGKWQSKYEAIKGNVYCSIGIKLNDEWVWRSDVGTESNVEKEKGEASDAFKRACVQWGIGRFLYDLEVLKVKTNGKKDDKNKFPFVVGELNERIYNLTDWCNTLMAEKNFKKEVYKPTLTQTQYDAMLDAIDAGQVDRVKSRIGGYTIKKEWLDNLNKLLK